MRVFLLVGQVLTLLFLSYPSSAEEEHLKYLKAGHKGIVMRLTTGGTALLNYYKSIPVFEAQQHDVKNGLYAVVQRPANSPARVFRITSFHIPLTRGSGSSFDYHREAATGIQIDAREPGYTTLVALRGVMGIGLNAVQFFETAPIVSLVDPSANPPPPKGSGGAPEAQSPGQSSGQSSGKSSGKAASENLSGEFTVPNIPRNLKDYVLAGKVVAYFGSANGWEVFTPVWLYEDFMYATYENTMFRVLYRLDPILENERPFNKQWLVGFPASGGFIDAIPADRAIVENSTAPFGRISEIDDRLNALEEKTIPGLTERVKKLESVKPGEWRCEWSGWTQKFPLEINKTCPKGQYVNGVGFKHPIRQDYTYQESVRILCCTIK